MINSRFISAIFLQFMGTVGSGIFVLPYLYVQSNFLFATFFLIYLSIITALLNHFYVEIVSATTGDHQLTGYSQIYLGKKFKLVTTINLILLALGAIVAYSKLFQSFFALLFPTISLYGLFVYLFVLSISYIFGQKLNQKLLFIIPVFILIIPILLFIFSITNYGLFITDYKIPSFSFYGATLFALSGFTIIPEVQEKLGSNKKFSLAVLLGVVLTTIIYFLYTYSVATISGSSLSIDSVTGLLNSFPRFAHIIAFFGLIITLQASINFLQILHELFYRDLKFSLSVSNILSTLFPLLTLALTSIPLLTIISLTGDITIFVSAVIIILIRLRLPRTFTTEFSAILIILSLTFGLLISLFS